MSNYFEMIEPHHLVLARAETAAAIEDEPGFWSAIEENLRLAWCSGQVGDKWGIINLLHDVWSDPFSKGHFCELLDIQFERWINVIENAKRLGWIDQEMDAKAMITVFWSASVGQVIDVSWLHITIGTWHGGASDRWFGLEAEKGHEIFT